MDSSIDLSLDYADSGVSAVLEELDAELVGLKPVKTRIKEIAALLLIDRARQHMNLNSSFLGLHMSFTGRPGTGKTTVARRISRILHQLGYLRKGHLVTATRDDLVGQYVGHTAPKTREMIKRAQGGVLFIDEAYYLYKPGNERDYGEEAIEILLQEMEKRREDIVVVFAGYKERMNVFYKSNPGLSSRIAHHIDFPDYSNNELFEIAQLLLSQQNYCFSKEALTVFKDYIKRRRELPFFANARSVRNALDRARLRQASRLFSRMGERLTRQELMTIDALDIKASRVFQGEIDGHEIDNN
ncbi:CbbX protein [Prochlorococcus sp. MIT 1300]|uniref:CbbX protein n=1 Tax=Prochlorococcus sp. MIT 1300 TaxID=3096218 RepID=UPI002A76620A|nr:CbbX protein [Prochlorococcus sp. MIT 1300]